MKVDIISEAKVKWIEIRGYERKFHLASDKLGVHNLIGCCLA